MPKTGTGELAGRTAVVTGGGQGIGATIARSLAGAGARVVVNGRHEGALNEVCQDIAGAGGTALACAGSVTDPLHLDKLMKLAAGQEGVIDILVNNAGIAGPTAPLADVKLAQWEETLAVNLTGVFLACQAALPYLRASDHGRIVCIGSAAGKRPLPNRTPYAASKLGLVGLARTLAAELGPSGITVNVVSPWLVDNARLTRVLTAMAAERRLPLEQLRSEMEAGTALHRAVREDEVAAAVQFLCSDGAESLTGQDLNVSAGAVMY
ncbi:MAG TPA: SDR family oxidoreductase [Acidimicrobiales bacterium]|nr:SDR family oxidoreductase [Acidimicrobiales bacterium]